MGRRRRGVGLESELKAPVPPTVTQLLTTPVKGFALSTPSSVTLDTNGAVGDRDFFVVDAEESLISITRTGAFASWRAQFAANSGVLTLTGPDNRTLEDRVVHGKSTVIDFWESREVTGYVVGGPWSAWLSEIAGRPVRLVRAQEPGGGYDEAAVTVISAESVAELAQASDAPSIDIRRFRMLLNISGVAAYEEEAWIGRRVSVGSAVLQMAGPVPRCNATTRNPDTGERDLKTLKLITELRGMQPNDFGEGLNLGAYATVVEPGVISVGDVLTVT